MIEYISYHRGKCYVFTQYRKFWVNSLHDENVQEGDDYMNYIGNMVNVLFTGLWNKTNKIWLV